MIIDPLHTSVILLGSNLGDKFKLLNDAMNKLSHSAGKIKVTSSIYESQAWGFESDSTFFNAILVLSTPLDPWQLLKECQRIEMELGREREPQSMDHESKTREYSSRTIDIDILDFDGLITNTPTLILPHPKLHLRKFTLLPLQEVIPEWIHPILKVGVKELLTNCNDIGEVKILPDISLFKANHDGNSL